MASERDTLAALKGTVDARPDNLPGSKTVIADKLTLFSLVEKLLTRVEDLETRVAALEKQ